MSYMTDYSYENFRRVCYEEGATFVPVCPHCGRFVKADNEIYINDVMDLPPNATCSKCGRIVMPFEGFV